MKTITTRYGRKLTFDEQRWTLSKENYTCKIVEELEEDYLLLDANNLVSPVPKATIRDNAYEIVGDEVTLSEGVYAKWITNPIEVQSNNRFQSLFSSHRDLLFANRQTVLSRGEYYSLSPDRLQSGAAYIGGFHYSLGALFEAFEEKVPGVYYERFAEHSSLYLVCLSGSPLSGSHNSLFWSDEHQKFPQICSYGRNLPGGFYGAYCKFKDAVKHEAPRLSYPGEVLAQLLDELGVNEEQL